MFVLNVILEYMICIHTICNCLAMNSVDVTNSLTANVNIYVPNRLNIDRLHIYSEILEKVHRMIV